MGLRVQGSGFSQEVWQESTAETDNWIETGICRVLPTWSPVVDFSLFALKKKGQKSARARTQHAQDHLRKAK